MIQKNPVQYLHDNSSGIRTSDVDIEKDFWQSHLAQPTNKNKRTNFQVKRPMAGSTSAKK